MDDYKDHRQSPGSFPRPAKRTHSISATIPDTAPARTTTTAPNTPQSTSRSDTTQTHNNDSAENTSIHSHGHFSSRTARAVTIARRGHGDSSAPNCNRGRTGIRNKPRLIARTDAVELPWTFRPLTRTLLPITDASLIKTWNLSVEILADKLSTALTVKSIEWTALIPVVIDAKYVEDTRPTAPVFDESVPEPAPQHGTYLLVAVHPRTCLPADGISAAAECRRILAQILHRPDIHVIVCELELYPTSPEAYGPPEPSVPTMEEPSIIARNAVFDNFYTCFGELEFHRHGCEYRHTLFPAMEHVQTAIASMLPFPGQIIQQVDECSSSLHPKCHNHGVYGTAGFYVELRNNNMPANGNICMLASRHIVLGNYYERPENSLPQSVHVSWGDAQRLSDKIREIDAAVNGIRTGLVHRLRYRTLGDDAQIQLAKNCADLYVPPIATIMHQEAEMQISRMPRSIGYVSFAGQIDRARTGFWSDWALVSVYFLDTEASSDEPLCPPMHTNHVYIGANLQELTAAADEDGVRVCEELRDYRDEAGFLQLREPAKKDPHNWIDRYVFKCGAATGLTMGRLSPALAIVRRTRPKEADVLAWSLPILPVPSRLMEDGMPCLPRPFSAGGDAGACVFDETGNVFGMLEAGVGAGDPEECIMDYTFNISFCSPYDWIIDDIRNTINVYPLFRTVDGQGRIESSCAFYPYFKDI